MDPLVIDISGEIIAPSGTAAYVRKIVWEVQGQENPSYEVPKIDLSRPFDQVNIFAAQNIQSAESIGISNAEYASILRKFYPLSNKLLYIGAEIPNTAWVGFIECYSTLLDFNIAPNSCVVFAGRHAPEAISAFNRAAKTEKYMFHEIPPHRGRSLSNMVNTSNSMITTITRHTTEKSSTENIIRDVLVSSTSSIMTGGLGRKADLTIYDLERLDGARALLVLSTKMQRNTNLIVRFESDLLAEGSPFMSALFLVSRRFKKARLMYTPLDDCCFFAGETLESPVKKYQLFIDEYLSRAGKDAAVYSCTDEFKNKISELLLAVEKSRNLVKTQLSSLLTDYSRCSGDKDRLITEFIGGMNYEFQGEQLTRKEFAEKWTNSRELTSEGIAPPIFARGRYSNHRRDNFE